MQLILDFETNTTIEEHLSELAEFLEKVRIMRALSYSELQIRAKQIDCGVNLAMRIKNANMVSRSLIVLSSGVMLNFYFKIEDQYKLVVCESGDNHSFVMRFMTYMMMYNKESGMSRDAFSRWLGVSNYSVAKWPTTKEVTLKYLFKCMKALNFKMTFEAI